MKKKRVFVIAAPVVLLGIGWWSAFELSGEECGTGYFCQCVPGFINFYPDRSVKIWQGSCAGNASLEYPERQIAPALYRHSVSVR